MTAAVGRKIAIDASMSLYQFLIAVRQDGQQLVDSSGETTRWRFGGGEGFLCSIEYDFLMHTIVLNSIHYYVWNDEKFDVTPIFSNSNIQKLIVVSLARPSWYV